MKLLTHSQIRIGAFSLFVMFLLSSIGVISYSRSKVSNTKKWTMLDTHKDTFNVRALGKISKETIVDISCESVKQTLLVTDDTVIIDFPNDSLRMPLFGKPQYLTNENRTLVCKNPFGEVFSLTYFFDPTDTLQVSPVLMVKRQSIEPMLFLSHSNSCEKLKRYLAGN